VGCAFQQTVGIPLGTNCTPFLTNIGFLKINEKKLVQSFNIIFRYSDDSLSLNNYVWWLCWSRLFHWSWNNECHRYSLVCFIHWPRAILTALLASGSSTYTITHKNKNVNSR